MWNCQKIDNVIEIYVTASVCDVNLKDEAWRTKLAFIEKYRHKISITHTTERDVCLGNFGSSTNTCCPLRAHKSRYR